MVAPRFTARQGGAVRIGGDGRAFIITASEERLYLETAPPTVAVHGNPGFEDQTAGIPDVWDFFWANGVTEVESETVVRYSGTRSCRVHVEAGGGQQVVMSDTFDVPSSSGVDFSAFAVADEGSPTISLGLVTGASGVPVFLDPTNYTNNENSPAAIDTDWQQYARFAKVPTGHTKARLFFRIAPDATEAVTVYLDLTASTIVASEVFDSGWLEYDYGTGWEAWSDTTVELPRCRREGDWVTLCGFVQRTSGAGTTVCTLPEELWPSRGLLRGGQVIENVSDGVVTVGADGVVTLAAGAYSNGDWLSLDVRYPVNQD